MFWLKGCPRCCGDLYVDQDQYGSFVSCLQCGLNRELASQPGEPLQLTTDPSLPAQLPQWHGDDTRRRRVSHGGRHFAKSLTVNEEAAA